MKISSREYTAFPEELVPINDRSAIPAAYCTILTIDLYAIACLLIGAYHYKLSSS